MSHNFLFNEIYLFQYDVMFYQSFRFNGLQRHILNKVADKRSHSVRVSYPLITWVGCLERFQYCRSSLINEIMSHGVKLCTFIHLISCFNSFHCQT